MKFSLIICTYQRAKALLELMDSVKEQSLYPDQIIIVDGSEDHYTREALEKKEFEKLEYYKIGEENRGLTKQRNFGISRLNSEVDIACFLDDDIILTPTYFSNLISGFKEFPDAIGFGGYILNDIEWKKINSEVKFDEFEYDGFFRKLGSRNLLRKKLGLLSDQPPGIMPNFSNGFSISFLPPSGKIYPVEYFMGGVAAYKKSIFEKVEFSSFFEGYGLYEDMDFCLRVSRFGQLYVNTSAKLYHYHEISGRPDYFKYGKMVINNGWYVWRIKNPKPSFKSVLKWNATAILLITIRLTNILNTKNRMEAFSDAAGRIAALFLLPLTKRTMR